MPTVYVRPTISELVATPVRGGTLTVEHVLHARRAVLVEVRERPDGDFEAVAATQMGGTLIHLGSSPFDAVQRLATMVLRP